MISRRMFKMVLKGLHRRNYIQEQGNMVQKADSRIPLPEVEYDINYFCNPLNRNAIYENIKKRRRDADIDKILHLSQQPSSREAFLKELSKLPNMTDPNVIEYGDEPKILEEHGVRPTFPFKPLDMQKIANELEILKMNQLGPVAGQRAYAYVGNLANLEQALISYCFDKLTKQNFKLVSVPDILPTEIIRRCGLVMDNERTLVYELENFYGEHLSLSGTAEMALAFMLMNKVFQSYELPLKLAAVSRCYRAEASSLAKERGLYRVHQFTKVEMFSCCDQEQSYDIFHEFINIQKEIYSELGIWFKVLDMPPHELGSPAFRKVDIEGWMPGRQVFGELTSCSNCTDYQSRRLNIKYLTSDGKLLHVHTLNGTACAIPRSIIAITEKYQTNNDSIKIPEVLVPYMNGVKEITGEGIPHLRSHKFNPRNYIFE